MADELGWLLTYWVDEKGRPNIDGMRVRRRQVWLEPDRDVEARMKATAWGGTLQRVPLTACRSPRGKRSCKAKSFHQSDLRQPVSNPFPRRLP